MKTDGTAIPRILVVDGEDATRQGLKALLTAHGAWVETTANLEDATRRNDHQPFDMVFVDSEASGEADPRALTRLSGGDTPPEIVLLASDGAISSGEAMRYGATDSIGKPLEREHILALTDRCLEARLLKARVERLQGRVQELTSIELVGQSAHLRQLSTRIEQVAHAPDTTILIEGESGTGKELVARSIHEMSSRRDGPFVVVNCAALSESLLEAELFGYEAGAFRGATREGKEGLFSIADGGTLLLDEISEMPTNLQAKLLRVLQERSYRRVGGAKDRPARARVIAASTRNLMQEVQAGRFKEDLFYRLHVITMKVVPLRDRTDDIPLLAHYFLDHFGRQMGKALSGFSEDAMETLSEHSWPGNVRELKNAVEHAAIVCAAGLVDECHLPRWDGGAPDGTDVIPRDTVELPEGDRSLRSVEKILVTMVLEETAWNISKAASMLGINRTTLYNKIKLHGLGSRPRATVPDCLTS
ncbi:MAG: sigma-54 dependent transcriptional regulator [Planctomycetota bacterium]|jgi:DNA-binding NtrC family response regulator|nr:sigma-54 dependent transcriptional regulator [Planctomycetota bacterium]